MQLQMSIVRSYIWDFSNRTDVVSKDMLWIAPIHFGKSEWKNVGLLYHVLECSVLELALCFSYIEQKIVLLVWHSMIWQRCTTYSVYLFVWFVFISSFSLYHYLALVYLGYAYLLQSIKCYFTIAYRFLDINQENFRMLTAYI